jgi:hypothetical protein
MDIINDIILPDKNFQEALGIARNNSYGKIWLIGGFLYKSLVHKPSKDFDIVVEEAKSSLIVPEGWERRINHFKGIKLVNGKKEIDFMPLADTYYIKTKNLIPSIDNFLEGAGLNIHCLAYDILDKKIIGDAGIRSLEDKTVSAYNREMLEYGASLYGKTPNEMIKQKAEELGFRYYF